MDISNISGLYSDIYSANNQSTTKLENQLNTDMTKATNDELMDACKQFEAYYLEQMFKSMMKTIPKNEEMSGSSSTLMDYYTDEMVQQLASDSTEQNSLGLAQMLYEQMKRNYDL
ncbi:MAG: rod-binding protein [Lachnospiraceae bacterium]|nr:rod-binding protein [Lachnospiraceae bacterium]